MLFPKLLFHSCYNIIYLLLIYRQTYLNIDCFSALGKNVFNSQQLIFEKSVLHERKNN